MKTRLVGLGVTALALVVLLAWWLGARPPATDAAARGRLVRLTPRPADVNVVVVTLDTTRADRLGCYGFSGVATPNIDRLAREGVLFERATATVPLTLPSHSSMFTGKVPPRHGVHDNGGFFLDEKETTLAERFKAAGYATGAFVSAWVLDSKWGIGQGFDHYSDMFDLSKFKVVSLGTVQKPGDEVMGDALRWMAGVKDRKFFSWVHLYDPHTPYDPPEPYRSRYANRYVGEIAWTDEIVGRLTAWLEAEGLLERTVVILTGDHGESLGEHGENTHGFFIYDATTHVPLIVRTPWGLRGRAPARVSSVDIFPTVLDVAGLAPEPGVDGRSLLRLLMDTRADPGHVAYSESYYPRFHHGWQHLQGLHHGDHQFIEAPTPELYDLSKDPAEQQNLYKSFGVTAEGLRTRLRELSGSGAGVAAPDPRELDPDTLQRLAALGYVGGAVEVDPNEVLADPKDKIGLYALMHKARDLGQKEKTEEAVAVIREVLAQDPKIIDAYLTLGNWLSRLRRDGEAEAAYKQALALKPDHDLAMTNLARLYRGRGESEKAIEGYKAALELDPRTPQTWYQLATLYLDLGRVAAAERTFQQALMENPKMGAAMNSLGVIAWARGQKTEAEQLTRQALEREPELRTGRFNLARILEARGERAGAEALYREELDVYPDNGKARFNLAQLLREKGDRDGYLRELIASVEKAPDFGAAYFFLAREELKNGGLDGAFEIAERGLQKDPASDLAPLGHFILADVWSRRGDARKAQAEAEKARRLEAALRARPRPLV